MTRWLLIAVIACVGCDSRTAVSSKTQSETLRFAVTDVEGMEQLQIEFGAFRDLLQEKTGFDLLFFPVASRTAAAEALAHRKVDLVLTGPAEYVMFQSRAKIKPVIGLVRSEYYSVFAVLETSPVQDLSDLRNKKIAMGSIGSTSKHLAPVAMLADAGIAPNQEAEVVHTPIRTGWEMLQRGQVDAFAMTSDKYELLSQRVESKTVRVVAKSDPLPNDVLLAREDLPAFVVDSIRSAMSGSSDEFVAAILHGIDNQKYRNMQFDVAIEDSDYDEVRKMFVRVGLEQFAGSDLP